VTAVVFTAYQKKMIIILGLIMLTLAVYWEVQHFGFVNYDDNLYVTENYQVQSGLTFKGVIGIFSDISTGNWHPLTMISHMLDWELFGQNAGGHHWSSLVLHIINTVLLFLLLNQMTGAIWRSALVAALFAIHPINVESVAWISERKNVLSTFFWFLTMMFYGWYVGKPHWKRYLPVFICFALGLMSKSMLVTLPFVLLLMDYWPLNRTWIDTRSKADLPSNLPFAKSGLGFLILEKIPLFVLTVIFSGLALYAQQAAKAMAGLDFLPLSMRLANAIVSYVYYLGNMFWPLYLAVFYPIDGIALPLLIMASVLLIFITVICCFYVRKYPYLAVGWFWYLGTLTPVIGLVQVGAQAMADRYAYVPLIGIYLMVIFGLADILKYLKAGRMMMPMAIFMVIIMTYFTPYQVQCWENNYTLYIRAIDKAKPSILPYKNLGIAMINENKPEEAAVLFRKAIALKSNDPTLFNGLGVALTMMGDYVEAERQYRTVLQLNPSAALAYNNLGMICMHSGRNDEALKYFQEAIRLQPQFANAHYRLFIILKKKGLNEKADYHYNEAIRINPAFEKLPR